jgi:hypothetical protein
MNFKDIMALMAFVLGILSSVHSYMVKLEVARVKTEKVERLQDLLDDKFQSFTKEFRDIINQMGKTLAEQSIINKFTAQTLENIIKEQEVRHDALNALCTNVAVLTAKVEVLDGQSRSEGC